jgi:ATP phosphoribosyltransferase
VRNNKNLILAVPSKGRLQDRAVEFLGHCGFRLRRSENEREYSAELAGVEGVKVAYYRPEEIPERIEQGDAHAGITGEDLFLEYGEGPPASHIIMRNLGFGAARLVIAVPQSWVDVVALGDLHEVAMIHRQKRRQALRVATKFPHLTRAFFARQGIVDYRIVESLGATEGAPASGIADLIVDLTSTGATLAQNHLKEISGGTLLKTDACIVASLGEDHWSQSTLGALERIVEQVEARLTARSHAVLRFALPPHHAQAFHAKLEQAARLSIVSWTPGAGRTGDDGDASGYGQVVALSDPEAVYETVRLLRTVGCERVMVESLEFLYERRSRAFEAFEQLLKRRGKRRADDGEA